MSLSARRAWIEIKVVTASDWASVVALRKESVDRNPSSATVTINKSDVALRKESVDRNTSPHSISSMILTSLSARRAWIEIFYRNLPW